MHTSQNVKVLIDTDSIPIIEKCKDVRFAKFTTPHDVDKEEAALTEKIEIQDFDAPGNLTSEKQNWSLLDNEQYNGIQAIVGSENLGRKIGNVTSENVNKILKNLGL